LPFLSFFAALQLRLQLAACLGGLFEQHCIHAALLPVVVPQVASVFPMTMEKQTTIPIKLKFVILKKLTIILLSASYKFVEAQRFTSYQIF
jgi:hypothetical protein